MNAPDDDTALDGFAGLGLRAETLAALDDLGLRGTDTDPARDDPAADRRQRPARTGRDRHRQDRRLRAAGARTDRRLRSPPSPVALILVPTRELAVQVSEAIFKYGRRLGAKVVPIYGGQPISPPAAAARSRRAHRRRHARDARSTTSVAGRCRSTTIRGRRARRGRRDARHGLRRRHRVDPRRHAERPPDGAVLGDAAAAHQLDRQALPARSDPHPDRQGRQQAEQGADPPERVRGDAHRTSRLRSAASSTSRRRARRSCSAALAARSISSPRR